MCSLSGLRILKFAFSKKEKIKLSQKGNKTFRIVLTRLPMSVSVVFAEFAEFNKPLQVTGVFLATFDSCSTPFIYAASMPIFRSSLQNNFERVVSSRIRKAITSTRRKSEAQTRVSHTTSTGPEISLLQSSSSTGYLEGKILSFGNSFEEETSNDTNENNCTRMI